VGGILLRISAYWEDTEVTMEPHKIAREKPIWTVAIMVSGRSIAIIEKNYLPKDLLMTIP
jgi:hypothetical protein